VGAYPPVVGARVQLYVATENDVAPGAYYVPNLKGEPKVGFSTAEANDPEVARKLWQVSEELLDLKFEI